VVILGGDQLNCGPIAHWNRGKPILVEGTRLKNEYDLLLKEVIEPLEPIERKVWIQGNHERFLHDFIQEENGLEGLIEPENYLKLRERGWEIVPNGGFCKVGKLYFYHGDKLAHKGSKVTAERAVKDFRRNIRFGHFHSFQGATAVTPADIQDQHTAILVPALCRRNMAYANGIPSASIQGFIYGYVRPNGNFNDYVVFCNTGAFVAEGKLYQWKK
jgi:hypothetical protein